MIRKFSIYVLIIIALVGFLGVAEKTNAQGLPGTCTDLAGLPVGQNVLQSDCLPPNTWTPDQGTTSPDQTSGSTQEENKDKELSEFEETINKYKCGLGIIGESSVYPGCVLQIIYGFFYVIPSWFLWIAAYLFNVLVSITLYTGLLKHSFVSEAWGVVRDLSNIFFILILLYVAIKIILNLGEHEAKGMIVKVLIIALLINFSMFFTKVVVDASNILALIFYNKLEVNTTENGASRPYSPVSKEKTDKDVAGGMVNAFDPTKLLTEQFLDKARRPVDKEKMVRDYMTSPSASNAIGGGVQAIRAAMALMDKEKTAPVQPGILIGITLLTGAIMIFAAYCFFVAGFAFLSRLIELFILIIFSPFAFMSFTVPKFATMEYMGWNDWFKRLIKVSFMAPIFMFFMYFIFLLIGSKIYEGFVSKSSDSFIESILSMVIPAVLILILLLKATEFAKKGSGTLGEMASGAAKAVGGLALGAATGGAAMLGTGLIGKMATKLTGDEKLKEKAKEKGLGGYAARMALKTANYGSKASFDVRQTGAGKWLAKQSGLDWQKSKMISMGSKEGGFKGAVERKAKALQEESQLYKTTKTDKQVQDWSKARQDEYDERKAIVMNEHKNMTSEEYEERYGPRPKESNSADELNKDRMEAFRDNLGQSDLLGTIVYQSMRNQGFLVDDKEKVVKDGKEVANERWYKTSQEYVDWKHAKDEAQEREGAGFDEKRFKRMNPEPTAQSINDGRVKANKMAIGGFAALATGGLAGGAIAAGAGVGAVLGGGLAGAYATTESAAEAKFAGELTKGLEKMGKISDRIKENTDRINKLTKVITDANNLKDEVGNPLKDGDGRPVELRGADGKINTEEVERQLARIAFIEESNRFELKRLREAGKGNLDPEVRELMKTTISTDATKRQLTQLRTAERDIHNLQKENIDLNEKKSVAEKEQTGTPKEGKKEEGSAPAKPHGPAASPSTPSTPAGEGGGAHGGGHK